MPKSASKGKGLPDDGWAKKTRCSLGGTNDWAMVLRDIPFRGGAPVPILLFILLIILIAQVGFWKTLGAVIGAAAMFGLFVVLLLAAVAVAGYMFYRRMR